MAIYESYNCLFLWDYTFHEWGFLSTFNWYNLDHFTVPSLETYKLYQLYTSYTSYGLTYTFHQWGFPSLETEFRFNVPRIFSASPRLLQGDQVFGSQGFAKIIDALQ